MNDQICYNSALEFLESAGKRGTSKAILAPDRRPLSYAQLCRHVDHIVSLLNSRGLGRNDRVAIVLPRGPELAVALLSVIAGFTCVPLSNESRKQEYELFLSDVHARALIVQRGMNSHARAAAKSCNVPVIDLIPRHADEAGLFDLDFTGEISGHAVEPGFALPDDNAVIAYSSGTTSRPKLIPWSQKELFSAAHAVRSAFALGPADRCLNVMPLYHLHGLISCLLASLYGGGSVVCTKGFDPDCFFDWICEYKPTWYSGVSAIHHSALQLAETYPDKAMQAGLRFIRHSSTPLSPSVLKKLEERFNAPVIEVYGMTEITPITINPIDPLKRKPGSAGRSVGPDIAIMDHLGGLLPSGQEGEIVIRSEHIVKGCRDALVNDHHKIMKGWFRTGDQGYIDTDGYLFISDRLNEIINCGGHKVSPSEIDRTLLEHPSVKDVATFGIPHISLGETVAAAVVFDRGAEVSEKELRSFLAGRLAPYKVPRQIVSTDRIPRGDIGKLQRRNLAEYFSHLLKRDYVPPSTETEVAVSRIWQEVLGAGNAGIHDDLFLLGGNSISAAQILSRIHSSFNVQLPVQIMFDSATIAGLSAAIDEKLTTAERTQPARISRERSLPLSFGQESLWFLDQLEPGSPAYNISRALRVRGKLSTEALEYAIREIIRRHETLRTVFISQADGPVQRITPAGDFNLEFIDVSALPEEQREDEALHYTKEEACRTFDLAKGPLLRAVLLRLGPEEHMLLLTVHHIVFDAWSMGILYRELSLLYDAYVTGEPSSLPDLPFQYADYAVWQRQFLQGEKLREQIAFWKELLRGATMPDLPTDYARPPVRTLTGTRYTLQLSGGLTKALLDLGRSERSSLFMTALTAFKVLLRGYTGHDDIVIGTPVANRNRAEIEGLIGFFVNMLVLRTDTSGDPPFRELLKRVKKRLLDAYTYQELPFEKLVEELRPDRDPGVNPLFQIGFAMQNVPFSDLVLSGLTVSRIEIEDTATKFDLEVYLLQTAEGLRVTFVYNTDLFNAVTIERMAAHYQRMLEGIASDPDQSLSRLIIGDEVRGNEQVKKLTDLWADVLGRKTIGIHDDFFESGGDSLKASRCLFRMKGVLGMAIPYDAFYQNPTVSGILGSLDKYSLTASIPQTTETKRDDRDRVEIPLAVCQEEIWSTQMLGPGLPVFNESFAIFIHEETDEKILEEAFRELIRRHSILRTGFRLNNSGPVQCVRDEALWSLSVHDLCSVALKERDNEVKHIAETLARKSFDLDAPPLMRALLVHLGSSEYILYIVLHHLVVDAVTMYSIFVPQLQAFYRAGLNGGAPAVARPSVQYADYVYWQRDLLQDNQRQKHLEYWKGHLDGTSLLELPTDRPRSASCNFRGEFKRLSFSRELTGSLHVLGQRHGATFFMVLLAAFKVLLWRYTRDDVITVGSIDGWRGRPDLEQIAGCCMNSLVFRTELSGDPPFTGLLRRVRETALQTYAHKDVPFGEVVKKLRYFRDKGRHPLFRAVLVLEPPFKETGSDWQVSQLEVQTGTSKFELAFELEERSKGIIGRVEYDTSLFDSVTIERMISHYEVLLTGIVHEPECPISRLPLLTGTEQHQLLEQWNDTESNITHVECIHELFERQAEKMPDAVAVISGKQNVPYRDLNSRANQLAHYLITHGVRPQVKVGICAERSVEAIVCILAVLKAGGVYVPLDPSYPEERLSYMLKDSMAGVLLVQGPFTAVFPEHEMTTVRLDIEKDRIGSESRSNPAGMAHADDSAYIIYTSGSTGLPKGVAVSHRSLSEHCLHMVAHYGLDRSDRVLQFASLNFDASLEQIFPPLLAGAAVVLRDNDLWTPPELFEKILYYGLTVINLPPSYFHDSVQYAATLPAGASAHTLRLIICGGDELRPETVRLWGQSSLRSARLLNAYGPTETTITATTFEITAETLRKEMPPRIPIGRPLPNRKIYILDRFKNPVPSGVPGELYIGGACLALEYLNRSELTAEKFIPDPFSPVRGARLYKTGDLARYLQDGNIEFLGRNDHQVKVRGFRIEPGEIEAVLGQHPGIREVVVAARESVQGDNRLAAFIVPHTEQSVTPDELKSYLTDKLPVYMVPSYFVMLESLPKTPVGKIDRRALPDPDFEQSGKNTEYIAPRSPVETLLAEIWSRVLGIRKVGIHDNFFSLGGHSLLAVQVITRMNEAFNINVPLRRIFETPTVAGLSHEVSMAAVQEEPQAAEPADTASAQGAFPLSLAQQRLWFLSQMEPDSPAYNISIALRINGHMNVNALEGSIGEILRRHEVLRSVFSAVNDEPVQMINPAAVFTLQQLDISNLPEQQREPEAKMLAQEELSRVFNLEAGPLLRAVLARLKPQEHILILTVHHIVYDAWSAGILYRELSACYEAFAKGIPASLPELPMQYAKYALWQRTWLHGGKMEEQIRFWKEQLRDITPLDLPADRPRPEVQTFNGARHVFMLPADVTETLRALSIREQSTLFMTFLAAFQVVLHRYTGQSDIAIGIPIANRNLASIEGLIGFFVNTLVIRTDTSGNPAFRELLARVRKVLLDAYSHQDLPFEKLVEELKPRRDLSRNPLFQVLFTLQNALVSNLELAGLTVSRMELEDTRTRFDLEVHLSEEAEGLRGAFIYNTDLFDAATISRMAGHYQMILKGIAAGPDQRLSELPMLTDTERLQLLVEWNDTRMDYPRETCVHNLFQTQAERTPEALAVIFGDDHLTYRGLNDKANRLARFLRNEGAGPEVLVAICVERSVEMVICVMGVLKAGGAYVPLDPEYPKERLGFMMEDSGALLLLTQTSLAEKLPENKANVISLDQAWKVIEKESTRNLSETVSSGNLAYVLYTSGSTGRPKGVAMEHRPLCNLISWQISASSSSPGAKTLQFAPLSFDVSFQEIFSTLCSGGTLMIAPARMRRDPVSLIRYLEKESIGRIFLPFVALLQLAEVSESHEIFPHGLREVITAGEQLRITPSIAGLFRKLGDCKLYNQYGPTESHVVTSYMLSRDPAEWPLLPPIGRPVGNAKMYILDPDQNPVPAGVPGKLYIGGECLARGYMNRPDLTHDKFIPDPFSDSQGARLYASGDIARYLSDGDIEYLGRSDNQVKIRGFRIEPAEIEAALQLHSAVHEAVVVARGTISGEKRLIAYTVLDNDSAADAAGLRRFLIEKVPDYMVPSAFVVMDSLPLTPSGKIDRMALPEPDTNMSESGKQYVPPRDPLEIQLVGVWEKVLERRPVGITDNFFKIGGHSLLVMRLISETRKATGRDISVIDVFRAPAIEQMAELIRDEGLPGPYTSVIPVQPHGKNIPLFWVSGSYFVRHLEPGQPAYVLIDWDEHGYLPNFSSIEDIAAHCIQRLLAERPQGPYVLGGYCLWGAVAMEVARQLIMQGHQVSLLFLVDTSVRHPADASKEVGIQSDVSSLKSKVSRHVRYLQPLGTAGKITHMSRKFISLGCWLYGRLSDKIKVSVCRIYLFCGRPVPRVLMKFYVYNLYAMKLLGKYIPGVYPGRVVLIKSDVSKKAIRHDWIELIQGGITVHVLPETRHSDLLKEPYVGTWAKLMNTYLRDIQISHSGAGK